MLNNELEFTIEDAKKMLGTEFTYIFPDGDSIRAYVKAFDPKIGLSCWSFDLITAYKITLDTLNKDEKDAQAVCLIAFNFKYAGHTLTAVLTVLEEIFKTNKRDRRKGKQYEGFFRGCEF